jgi:hypothetical protein
MRLNVNAARMAVAVGGAAAVLFAAGEAKAAGFFLWYDPMREVVPTEISGLANPAQYGDYIVADQNGHEIFGAIAYVSPNGNSAYAELDVSSLPEGTYTMDYVGSFERATSASIFVINRTPKVFLSGWGAGFVECTFWHMPTTAAYFWVALNERTPTGDYFMGLTPSGMNQFGGGNVVINYTSQGNYPMYFEAQECDASFNCTTLAFSPLFQLPP